MVMKGILRQSYRLLEETAASHDVIDDRANPSTVPNGAVREQMGEHVLDQFYGSVQQCVT